ncbi:MAG: YigZ family protein [Bacteroidetes bacterium]|nr:YigZ family protein [Bacteroidota bacterium]
MSEVTFRDRLCSLRIEHPKAVHLYYAWSFGANGLRCKSSDRGEPIRSAGKSILGQLENQGITMLPSSSFAISGAPCCLCQA